jgi:hypothetical protein
MENTRVKQKYFKLSIIVCKSARQQILHNTDD